MKTIKRLAAGVCLIFSLVFGSVALPAPAEAATPYVQWTCHCDGWGDDGRYYDYRGKRPTTVGTRNRPHQHVVDVKVFSPTRQAMVRVATIYVLARSH
jgi:hypothetical protein